jgi:hypothetical protein
MTKPTRSHGLRQITACAAPRTLMNGAGVHATGPSDTRHGVKSDLTWHATVLTL